MADKKTFIIWEGWEFTPEQKIAFDKQEAEKIEAPIVEPVIEDPIIPEVKWPETVPWAVPDIVPENWPETTPWAVPWIVPEAPEVSDQDTFAKELDNQKKEFELDKAKRETEEKIVTDKQVKETDAKTIEQAEEVAKNEKATASFNAALETGNLEDVAKISSENPELRDEFNAMVKANLKNKAWIDFFKTYAWMSNEEMMTSVNDWKLVTTSDQYKTLPPEQRAAFEAYRKEYDASQSWTKDYDKKNFEKQNTANTITVPTYTWLDLREKSKELMNSEELTSSSSKITTLEWEVNDYNDELAKIKKDVRKQYPNLPSSAQASIIADRQESITIAKNTKLNEYNTELGHYTRLKDNVSQELEFMKYEDWQAKYQYETELNQYNTNRALMSNVAIAEFEAKNKIAAEDTKHQRDLEVIDYKAKIAKWEIKGKWIEKDDWFYFAQDNWIIDKVLDYNAPWGVTVKWSFEWGEPYTEVYNVNNQWIGFTSDNTSLVANERELLNTPNGSSIPTRLTKEQLSPKNPWGKECWEYVNDIVARTVWEKIGSTWNDKLSYANEAEWEVWSVAVWQVDPNNKEMAAYGHTGVIIWETSDGNEWIIKSSNIKGKGVVSTVKVPKEVVNWYRTTNVIGKDKTFNDIQKTLIDSIDTKDLVKKDNKEALKEAWISLTEALEYKSQNITAAKKEDYTTALGLLDKMMDAWAWDWFSDAIWLYSWARNTSDSWEITFDAWTDAADFKAQFDALVDGLTLPNLDKMSWVLTDKDIELLKNASKWGLSLTMSERDFKKAVVDLRWALNRAKNWIKLPEWEVIFTDDDGVQYSKETLTEEIERAINAWEATAEQVRQYLKDNNINL